MQKPGTLPLVADTSGLRSHLIDAPAVPRRPKPKRRTTGVFVILVASLLVGNALIGDRGLMSMIRADREFASLSRLLTALRAENEGLRDEVRELKEEPRAIEQLAREELGLIRPGETLFIVTTVPAPE